MTQVSINRTPVLKNIYETSYYAPGKPVRGYLQTPEQILKSIRELNVKIVHFYQKHPKNRNRSYIRAFKTEHHDPEAAYQSGRDAVMNDGFDTFYMFKCQCNECYEEYKKGCEDAMKELYPAWYNSDDNNTAQDEDKIQSGEG